MRIAQAAIVAATLALGGGAAQAASVNIVALGASNTYGHGQGRHPGGASPGRAWPAQLQAMLRARGIDARVRNAGIPGDTTGGMLARLDSAVPPGTRIVILQPGGNDRRRGLSADRAGNIAAIKRRLRARHIRVVMIGKIGRIAPPSTHDPDGEHFDARGHTAIARSLVPRVIAAMR
ncbi:MAG TPA: GDSL-type esterase/lipase family protein [Pseudolabrys sp.]|nr:GDSL-type esterase/lipase family protein [Pseudolabrys sp.]